MKPEEVAALIVAGGGLFTAIGIQLRGLFGDRFQRRVDQAAALLSGYTEMVTNLRIELKECQEAGARALEAQRDHARRNAAVAQALFEREREEWRKDKAELKAELHEAEQRIDALQDQVVALIGRMDGREGQGQ